MVIKQLLAITIAVFSLSLWADSQAMLKDIAATAKATSRYTGIEEFSSKVMEKLETIDRAKFVDKSLQDVAFLNRPLPIGHGQTISQPFIVALMTEVLDLQENDKVLEIGTGSGYQAAVLAEIASDVYTIEIVPELAEICQKKVDSTRLQERFSQDGRWLVWLERTRAI